MNEPRRENPSTLLEFAFMLGNFLPTWARICLVSVAMVGGWYGSAVLFARKDDVTAALMALSQQFTAQIGTVQQQVTQVSNRERSRYSEQIDTEILDDVAKCHDTKNQGTKQLYAKSVSALVEEYRAANAGRDPPDTGEGACQ